MSASDLIVNEGQAVSGIEHVIAALKGLRFGQVTVVVQDGVIVRIDRTERRRLERQPRSRNHRGTAPSAGDRST